MRTFFSDGFQATTATVFVLNFTTQRKHCQFPFLQQKMRTSKLHKILDTWWPGLILKHCKIYLLRFQQSCKQKTIWTGSWSQNERRTTLILIIMFYRQVLRGLKAYRLVYIAYLSVISTCQKTQRQMYWRLLLPFMKTGCHALFLWMSAHLIEINFIFWYNSKGFIVVYAIRIRKCLSWNVFFTSWAGFIS